MRTGYVSVMPIRAVVQTLGPGATVGTRKDCSMTDWNTKVCLVTGASRGIGAATARHLASLGATVVLAARTVDAVRTIAGEIQAAGGTAEAVACDVASYGDVERAVTLCRERFRRIDILVNNAGLIDPIARLDESDPQAWGQVIDVNVKGVYHGLRAALPHMVAAGGGTVINISSGAATSALEGWSHYCSSKAAVLSLTACAHKEFADKGIRVIGMSPGTVATDMQVKIKASGVNPVSKLDPSDHIPPDWVARGIAWLCNEAADGYRGTDFRLRTEEGLAAVGLAGA